MIRITHISWLALCSALALGCGSDPKPPPDTANDANVGTPTPTATNDSDSASETKDGDKDGLVGVDERIIKMCDLPEARFNFDSASVSTSAKNMLNAIATCFVSGPAKGKGLRIVGHADKRGETEYNYGLGQRRAGAIAGFLTKAGVADERIATSSRGELEASGTDAQGMARDRRVEILLAD